VEREVTGEQIFHHSENGYFFLENLIFYCSLERKEGRKQCDIIQAGLKNYRREKKKICLWVEVRINAAILENLH